MHRMHRIMIDKPIFLRRTAIIWLLSMLALALLSIGSPPAKADPADIAAASRSVVRVVLFVEEDGRPYYVGHGTGFAVSDDMVVTNAHVVGLIQQEPDVQLMIIPSQGQRGFKAKLVSVSSENDLALIRIDEGRALPALALFTPIPEDGSEVLAIGYPGNVDRAQGYIRNGDMFAPISPVKTRGNVSLGRSSVDFDTILHDAPIAGGHSGGPLVDNCGRVVGVNSHISRSEGSESEFAFAVSNKELLGFLRENKVSYQTASSNCLSVAELDRMESERGKAANQLAESQAAQRSAERAKIIAQAEQQSLQQITTSRENHMAIAALMLVLSVLALIYGGIMMLQMWRNPTIIGLGGGGALMLGAILVFLLRPSYGNISEIAANLAKDQLAELDRAKPQKTALSGDLICRVDRQRSRITVSDASDLPLNWQNGCVNDRSQYGQENDHLWSRILVPNSEQTITRYSFDTHSGEFRSERYLMGLDEMNQARKLRNQYRFEGCNATPEIRDRLNQMQLGIKAAIKSRPQEIIIYQCEQAAIPAGEETRRAIGGSN